MIASNSQAWGLMIISILFIIIIIIIITSITTIIIITVDTRIIESPHGRHLPWQGGDPLIGLDAPPPTAGSDRCAPGTDNRTPGTDIFHLVPVVQTSIEHLQLQKHSQHHPRTINNFICVFFSSSVFSAPCKFSPGRSLIPANLKVELCQIWNKNFSLFYWIFTKSCVHFLFFQYLQMYITSKQVVCR